jgi:hypothetical protein
MVITKAYVCFEIHTAVDMNVATFRDTAPCSLYGIDILEECITSIFRDEISYTQLVKRRGPWQDVWPVYFVWQMGTDILNKPAVFSSVLTTQKCRQQVIT